MNGGGLFNIIAPFALVAVGYWLGGGQVFERIGSALWKRWRG